MATINRTTRQVATLVTKDWASVSGVVSDSDGVATLEMGQLVQYNATGNEWTPIAPNGALDGSKLGIVKDEHKEYNGERIAILTAGEVAKGYFEQTNGSADTDNARYEAMMLNQLYAI
jgi:hypothetical protein